MCLNFEKKKRKKKLISSAAALRLLCLFLANEDVETDDDDAANQLDGFCAATGGKKKPCEFSVFSKRCKNADFQLATAGDIIFIFTMVGSGAADSFIYRR